MMIMCKSKLKLVIIIFLCMIECGAIFLMCKSFSHGMPLTDELYNDNFKNVAIMIGDGTGNYTKNLSETFPTDMVFNAELSNCVDIHGQQILNSLVYYNGKIIVTSNRTSFCYVYFDEDHTVYNKILNDFRNNTGATIIPETEYDPYPIYYYTGNIGNNNIIYGDFCWKMVITTETGGIKLLYNGKPTIDSEGNKICNNTGSASRIDTQSTFGVAHNSLAYAGYMYNTVYEYKNVVLPDASILYGNSYTYENGIYTLTNTTTVSDWENNYKNLNNYHYTCLNSSGVCTNIHYIYFANSAMAYYITLSNNKSIATAINEMLFNDDVNVYDSKVKSHIDDWYESSIYAKTDDYGYLYSDYLENAIFCNSRSVLNYGGWNPNGGDVTTSIYFNYDTLTCENRTDQFTLSKDYGGTEGYGNNALKYPVGLLSYKEALLAGGTGYLKSNQVYWLLTPHSFSYDFVRDYFVDAEGVISSYRIYGEVGIRPVVSLKHTIKLRTDGDGTANNPYIAEL